MRIERYNLGRNSQSVFLLRLTWTVSSWASCDSIGEQRRIGGLLANSNLFQRIQTWGNALLNSRSQDCDSSSVTSSQISDIKRTIPWNTGVSVWWNLIRGNSKSAMVWWRSALVKSVKAFWTESISGSRETWKSNFSGISAVSKLNKYLLARGNRWEKKKRFRFLSFLLLVASSFKIVIWLILPVVICLSQRLSHACLSISNLYSETANGSLNQLSFIW